MRASVLRGRTLAAETLPEPVPGAGQVLVKTLACGICGSDLHLVEHGVSLAPPDGGPGLDLEKGVVLGHEFCAEILDYGPNAARKLPVGTRVCSFPVTFGAAGFATIGYSNEFPGGFAERMLLSEMLLLEVPNGLPPEHAALTEPMAVGVHAVAKARLEADDVPLVIGCGPVGLAVIAALKLRGAGPIIASDFSPKRRELAAHCGADIVLDPGEHSPYTRWREVAAPPGVDPDSPLVLLGLGPRVRPGVIFECVGVPGVIDQVIVGAPRGARVVVVGVCMQQDHFQPSRAVIKELNLQFVLGYTPDEFARTLRHLAEGDIDVAPLVTDRVGVDGIADAFRALGNPERHAKILAEPWR
jgi:2-desacetyl-2-hydroxyethyl bacteriochlorophyllide A dehydrogenase